jgi:hypothetical protein
MKLLEKDEFYHGCSRVMDANKDNALNADETGSGGWLSGTKGKPGLHLFAQWDSDANKRYPGSEFRNNWRGVMTSPMVKGFPESLRCMGPPVLTTTGLKSGKTEK